jgi:hypothetical protein
MEKGVKKQMTANGCCCKKPENRLSRHVTKIELTKNERPV